MFTGVRCLNVLSRVPELKRRGANERGEWGPEPLSLAAGSQELVSGVDKSRESGVDASLRDLEIMDIMARNALAQF